MMRVERCISARKYRVQTISADLLTAIVGFFMGLAGLVIRRRENEDVVMGACIA